MKKNKVTYKVEEIRGECPVYKVGDKIVIESDGVSEQLIVEESDAICMRVTDSMWNRLAWQSIGDEYLQHLVGTVGECRIACPHPGKPYTPCGTAIFRINRDGFEISPNNGPSIVDEKLEYPPTSLFPKEIKKPAPAGYDIEVYVHKVTGACPLAIEGTKFDFTQCTQLSEGQCGFSVNSVYQYVAAMSMGGKAVDLGIAEKGEDGFVTCPAWGPPTCEASVIFRLHPIPVKEGFGESWYEMLASLGHVSCPTHYMNNFASEETRQKRQRLIDEWEKLGRPKYWEKWGDVQKILSEDIEKTEAMLLENLSKRDD